MTLFIYFCWLFVVVSLHWILAKLLKIYKEL